MHIADDYGIFGGGAFGSSVAISGNVIAIGKYHESKCLCIGNCLVEGCSITSDGAIVTPYDPSLTQLPGAKPEQT